MEGDEISFTKELAGVCAEGLISRSIHAMFYIYIYYVLYIV